MTIFSERAARSIDSDVVVFFVFFSILSHCILCIFYAFCRLLFFFSKSTFEKNLSEAPSECQTVWVQTGCQGYQQSILVNREFNSYVILVLWVGILF